MAGDGDTVSFELGEGDCTCRVWFMADAGGSISFEVEGRGNFELKVGEW